MQEPFKALIVLRKLTTLLLGCACLVWLSPFLDKSYRRSEIKRRSSLDLLHVIFLAHAVYIPVVGDHAFPPGLEKPLWYVISTLVTSKCLS